MAYHFHMTHLEIPPSKGHQHDLDLRICVLVIPRTDAYWTRTYVFFLFCRAHIRTPAQWFSKHDWGKKPYPTLANASTSASTSPPTPIKNDTIFKAELRQMYVYFEK